MALSCIIVDDEPLAVKLLESFVTKTPELTLLASFTDSVEAINAVKEQKPNLLFLDIQMPDLNGMELAHMLPEGTKVIFTTAFKEYAFESYEVSALDFLLKPIRYNKFLAAVEKAHNWFKVYSLEFKDDYPASSEGPTNISTINYKLSTINSPLVVVLESVEKPGNLGAILRTAEAAGVDAVIVCDPLTDLYNPNLIRASIGGVFSVPVAVCNSKECIAFLKEHKIRILTAQLQDSYDYYDYDMQGATAIVMGTESTGLTDQWREAADAHIRIPMLGRLDSLNVSVSASILMYEAVRQRHKIVR